METLARQPLTAPASRVLIVDDDRDWCEAAALVLEVAGIGADCAFDGDAAVAQLGRERYDAAIIDVQLPGKSGVDVVRELRAAYGAGLPILIATGHPVAAGVCEGLLAGADDEFFKSDASSELIAKLRRLWRERAH